MLFYVFKFVFLFVFFLIFLGVVRTWQMERSSEQALFLKGGVPNPLPDGLYVGSISGRKVSWLGKKFNASQSTGINIFDEGGGLQGERYPFKTYEGKGVRDVNVDVLKIDYDIEGNPWWLRCILDEIVETAPGQYLGKLQFRILPGVPFTLGYFNLKK